MNTEDKFYFGNIGTKAESELTVRITKMLGEVERAVLSRNQEKAKSIASKVREMIRKSANTSTAKMQMDELNSIMLGVSFSRTGKADCFGMAEQVMRDGSVHLDFSAARDYLAKQSVAGLRYIVKDAKAARDAMGTEGKINKFNYYTDLVLEAQRELKKRGFSRPGQPERFARSYSGNSKKLNSGAVVAAWDDGDAVQFANATQAQAFSDTHGLAGVYQSPSSRTFFVLASKARSSRPGQPERFDASSLNRGNFAEASSSPMLGKLLSEKQMPEGGWRAVETGGGALVISFEDGDVAGNFARRVAGSGYSATAPVQSIGRYWNVEVKNGK